MSLGGLSHGSWGTPCDPTHAATHEDIPCPPTSPGDTPHCPPRVPVMPILCCTCHPSAMPRRFTTLVTSPDAWGMPGAAPVSWLRTINKMHVSSAFSLCLGSWRMVGLGHLWGN